MEYEENTYTTACHKVSSFFGKSIKKFREETNAKASDKLKKAIIFAGINVEPYETVLFAYFFAFIAFLISLLGALSILLLVPVDMCALPIVLFLPLIIPLFVLIFLRNYPMSLAERIKVHTLGRMPEVINYLVMSMRLSPSLNKAIGFAAENVDEPMATALKKMLWDVYMRKYNSIEDAFLAFAYEWGEWNDDFKRSLYAVRSAELESSIEGIHRGLEKATDIILTGTKRRMENFVYSLTSPTFVLFSLGILLPMILGAMLPMASMGGFQFGVWQVVIVMDVIFPFVTFAYAYSIIGKRPGTSSPPRIRGERGKKRGVLLTACVICVVLICLGMVTASYANEVNTAKFKLQHERSSLETPENATLKAEYEESAEFGDTAVGKILVSMGALPIVLGIGLPIAYYCRVTSKELKKKRDRVKQIEDEFPDALFQVGSRIAEGSPLESAFEKTGDAMRGTAIAEEFKKIAYVVQVTRTSLEDALFGSKGIMNNYPSRTVSTTMRTVVETVRKDVVTAGQTIVGISNYLRDMKKVEHDIRIQLSSVMEMMVTTGKIFAPIVMGITSALYFILQKIGWEASAGGLGLATRMPADVFNLILGVYLVLIVIGIMYFTSSIKHGTDIVEFKYEVGGAMPIALTIFTLSAIIGQMYMPM